MPLDQPNSLLMESEVRAIATVLGPAYIIDAAKALGGGDPVVGARAAYREATRIVAALLRSGRERLVRKGIACADAKAAAFDAWRAISLYWKFQEVRPLAPKMWRSIAQHCWSRPQPVSGLRFIECPTEDYNLVARSFMRSLSSGLRDIHGLNRAVLDGRVWSRSTPEIMVNVELEEDEIRPILVTPAGQSDAQMRASITKAMLQARRDLSHPLAPVGAQILNKWLDAGFIASPAGAMFSAVGYTRDGERNIARPHAALVEGNGVPIVVCIGEVDEGRCECRITVDHRALDPGQGGRLHRWLMAEVPKMIAEEEGKRDR